MAVSSGFFNSVNGDRKYNARQMAELFDGLINDGVYETIYNQFRISPNNGMFIQVDTGRGWFQHTWIKNDSILLIELEEANVLLDRIDAIVIEVDHRDPYRRDDIKAVKGVPSQSPIRPTLAKGENDVWQIPLSFIRVYGGATEITPDVITNMVGTSECPFVTGVVEVMNIDMLVAQWAGQWDKWYNTNTTQYSYDFNIWFSQLKNLLDGDVAGNLANQILRINKRLDTLAKEHILTNTIDDNNDDPILDSDGTEIETVVQFCVKNGDNCTCM